MFKGLRNVAVIFIALGISGFILGLSTYFWSEGATTSIQYKTETLIQNGYVGGKGIAVYRGGLASHWQHLSYSYSLGGQEFKNTFIGFFLPVNVHLDVLNSTGNLKSQSEKVFYLKSFPEIAVLQQGFDLRFVLSCIVIGVGLLAFRSQCITWSKNA